MKNEIKGIIFSLMMIILLIIVYLNLIYPDDSNPWLNLIISLVSGLFLFLFFKLEKIDYSFLSRIIRKIIP